MRTIALIWDKIIALVLVYNNYQINYYKVFIFRLNSLKWFLIKTFNLLRSKINYSDIIILVFVKILAFKSETKKPLYWIQVVVNGFKLFFY